MEPTGAYDAARASALSGVPRSTLHYWSTHEVLVPSVSATRTKLWSYGDLLGLRVIYWLRQRKTDASGSEIQASTMPAIRRALERLRDLDVPLARPETLWVTPSGEILVGGRKGVETLGGQAVLPEFLQLTAPFTTREGSHGPDLVRPRPEIRIVPGRLSGSPHIVDTRLETRALYALERDGFSVEAIAGLYPFVTPEQIRESLELEAELEANLRAAA